MTRTSLALLGLVVLSACSGSVDGSSGETTSAAVADLTTTVAPPSTTAAQVTTTSTTLPEWPDAVTRPFLADCSAVAAASDCRCVLDGARANMSSDRFVALAAESSRTGEVGDDLRAIVETCGAVG